MTRDADALLVLPGAGAGRDQAALVAIEDRLAPLPVFRREFAYRTEGRRFPDRAPKLVEELDGIIDEVAGTSGVPLGRLAVGGRSMGGRIASMWAAEHPVRRPAALVLISYPLHPPRHPEKLRTDHFGGVDVPCLFVSGTRDDFGTPEEMTAATAGIAGPVTHRWIDGARHDLRGRDEEVATVVGGFLGVHGRLGRVSGPSISRRW